MAVATLDRVRDLEITDVGASASDARAIVVGLELNHGQAMFGFVRRQGLSNAEAQDVVQEVLLRLWQELRDGVVVENPRAWAYRSIYRLAMDQHRLRRRIVALTGRLQMGQPGYGHTATEDRLVVWAEVDRLPVRQRQVVYLRYRADLSFEAIGSTLGITASAARSHATQAMTTLRKRLAPEERD